MPERKRLLFSLLKRLLFFSLIGVLTVAVGFIPDLVGDDLKAWCLLHFGPSYPWYLTAFFVFACFFLLAMSSEFKEILFLNRQAKIDKRISIAWSQAVKKYLQVAKETLKEAQAEETIKILFNLKNAVVDEQLSILSVRLAQYRQDSRLGTLTNEQKETAFNRIIKDIFDLMKAIENQLAESEKENQQLRNVFRQRYRDRLGQKLASRQPVNLRRFATTEGTSEQVAATFIPYSSDEIREEIGKTFQDAHGRLLIVGQPGAGKTTLLLQLADQLFDLEEDALPVVFNLATWQSSFGKLETWLETVLAAELSTYTASVKVVLRQSNLILLLDGLDELKEDEAINSCLAAIAEYGAVAGRHFVITCRIEEYKRVQEDARVHLEIEIGPLQGDQLEMELTRMGREKPEAIPLLQAIQKYPLLRQAVEVPFYFNTLQLLFAGRLPSFTTIDLENCKKEIQQKFVVSVLQNNKIKSYPFESAMHWLSFLAYRMNQRNKVVFELRDLQYDWWGNWSRFNLFIAQFIYAFVPGMIFGLVTGVGRQIFYGLFIDALPYGIISAIYFGLIFGLVNGLVNGFIRKNIPEITTSDFIHWSIKKYLISVMAMMPWGLFVGLSYWWTEGLNVGLTVGFGIILFGALIVVFGESSDFIYIVSPYQRFQASMKVLHFSILQHRHLQNLLYKKGVLPPDLVTFLNEMNARHLLETDGATWSFRHRIIQDYFAEQWVERSV